MFRSSLKYLVIATCVYYWKWLVPKTYYEAKIGNIDEFLESNGYPLEEHEVYTKDGYILTVHRIPHGRDNVKDQNASRPAVLLMHGLMLSSIDWIVQGPKKSLGLVLADSGYDVWLGNNRGNRYSRKHIKLDPNVDQAQFFNYSYHEIGRYDLPAIINHVINKTGHKKISYVGFSQGVTSYFVMSALRPQYNKKILVMNAFAPVTNMYNASSYIFNLLATYPKILKAAELIGWHEMFNIQTSPRFRLICQSRGICTVLLRMLGVSEFQMPDQAMQLTLLSNSPAGISLKQIRHYVQGIETGLFAPYNENSKAVKPEDSYNLTKVTAPTVIYYGERDNLVNQLEIPKLVAQLPNVKRVFRIPFPWFNHLDFLWGSDIELVIRETLRLLNQFNKIPQASRFQKL